MTKVSDTIDQLLRAGGKTEVTSAMTSLFRGINHRNQGNLVPANTDVSGLTFFTRPRLNLSYDNISVDRRFYPLLNQDTMSLQRAVRNLLDPIGGLSEARKTPIINNRNPFITILSNNLINLTGWPDVVVDAFTSNEGLNKEVYTMVDGYAKILGTFDLTATFKNIQGDPITLLFFAWTQYALLVQSGLMMPYPECIVENEIDYQTRIYRLVLDKSKRFVQKIAACGAAFPTANPFGSHFDFDATTPLNQANNEISIPFKCVGAEYNDPISIIEFNQTVKLFCPTMDEDRRATSMVLLQPNELNLFNYEGYPYITGENELQWWVEPEVYQNYVGLKQYI